jgi:4-alpha-glucanotransferase
MTPPSPLLALADSCGIQWHFDGNDAHTHTADEDVIRAVLRAWGVECANNEEARRLLRDRQFAAAKQTLELVLVNRIGTASTHIATLPSSVRADQLEFTLTLESGEVRRLPFSKMIVGAGPIKETDEHPFHAHQFDLDRTGVDPVPLGYHHAHLEGGGIDADALVVSAPPCPPAQRAWGLFMPLHALRSKDDWGIGSYSDLATLGHWAAEIGATMVGCLPLYPILTESPIDPSPYLPASKLAYNELFIDLSNVPEVATSPEVRSLLASDAFRRRVGRTHDAEMVSYDEVASLKHEALALLSKSLMTSQSPRRDAFLQFGQDNPEIEAYAQFQASRQHRVDQSDSFHTSLYGQWIAQEQLSAAEREIDLYADLPVGVHPDGFDPEYFAESFVTSAHGGAPPDLFFSGGQDWSFPPLHPERVRTDGYAYLRSTLRRAFRHAGALRVDHVMGIHRLYWIPEGFDAAHGAYVHSRAAEVRAIIALEAERSNTVVIGEDLGTVPQEVRVDMSQDHMLRSWVMQFESTATEPLSEPASTSLASWGTHDLPRFLSYFHGDDIDGQVSDGWMSAQEGKAQHKERQLWRDAISKTLMVPADDANATYMGCLEWMATSNADLVLIDLEELWGERVSQNLPGTGTERANWTRRGALSLEDAQANDHLVAQLQLIDNCRRLPRPRAAGPLPAGVGAEVTS